MASENKMKNESEDSVWSTYLENIDEYVNDENKIVTYKWLSLTLNIPPNVAKQLLYTFVVGEKEKKKDKLTVTYLLTGTVIGEGKLECVKVCVVRDEDLEKTKKKYKQVVSEHIYSVQKALLQDTNSLYITDYEATREAESSKRCSVIVCNEVEKRVREIRKQPAVIRQKVEQPIKKPSPAKGKAPAVENKKGSVASLFANQANKDTKSSKVSEADNGSGPQASKPNNTGPSHKKGTIGSMFAKQASKPKPEVAPAKKDSKVENRPSKKLEDDNDFKTGNKEVGKENASSDKKVSLKRKVEDSEFDDEDPIPNKNMGKNNLSKKGKTETERKNSSNTKKLSVKRKVEESDDEEPLPNKSKGKRNLNKKGSQSSKQRKRLMVMSDSSESEEVDAEIEDVPSPPRFRAQLDEEEDEEPIPASQLKQQKHTRKLISKTFIDEDGFLTTMKVYEDVMETEEVETPLVTLEKPPGKENSTVKATEKVKQKEEKKVAPSAKNKQATLMSFFQRKKSE